MRLETWIIGAALITLTLSAFVGFYMEMADSDHYNTIDSIPSDFAFYEKYKIVNVSVDDSAQEMENYTNLVTDMTEQSQNAPMASTGGADDMVKSQTNILKSAWNFFSDATKKVVAVKDFLIQAQKILHIPTVIVAFVIMVIVTLLLFAFLNAIFGRNL
jgi:hypothetical protein